MRFILIPSGTCAMGPPVSLESHLPFEKRREAVIKDAFFLQVSEVTNAQYRSFHPTHDSGTVEPDPRAPKATEICLDGPNQPVVNVDYDAAIAFAAWASRKDSERSYRLPTEEEWEHACRAGATTLYSFGDDSAELPKYANVADAEFARLLGPHRAATDLHDGFAGTSPVGGFRPNSWGLNDMHGNACEWCSTCFTFQQGLAVHAGPERRDERIYKGGAYSSLPSGVACHRRLWGPSKGYSNYALGFRLVAVPTQSPLPKVATDAGAAPKRGAGQDQRPKAPPKPKAVNPPDNH